VHDNALNAARVLHCYTISAARGVLVGDDFDAEVDVGRIKPRERRLRRRSGANGAAGSEGSKGRMPEVIRRFAP